MLRAVGRDGDRTVELALDPEKLVLWFRTPQDLWDMQRCDTVEQAYSAAERYGVDRTAWAPGPDFTLTDMVQAYALDAVLLARDQFQADLDFSEESVKQVEQILGQMYDQRPRGLKKLIMGNLYGERVAGFAKGFGSYVGEVFRRHYGGEWGYAEELYPGKQVIVLKWADNSMIFPPAKVHKRLMNGPEDDVYMFYRVFAEKCRERAAGEPPTSPQGS